jgi:hypothetical protein
MKTKIILAMLSLIFMESYPNEQVRDIKKWCKDKGGTVVNVKACQSLKSLKVLTSYITKEFSEESCTSQGGTVKDAKACQVPNGGPIIASSNLNINPV